MTTTGSSTATVYTKDGVDEKINVLAGDVTTNQNAINALNAKTAKLSPDGTKLIGMTAVNGTTVSGATVEAGALKVTGQISDGANVNTTLADIKGSMTQTETNKKDIANLTTTTGDQDTAIKDLQKKTTNISYADGVGTSIDGITVKDGNIVGNGNSAITQLANVETDRIKTDSINGKSLTGTNVATEKNVKDVADAVKTETDERKATDTALDGKITKNREDIATLNDKVATAEGNITDLKKKDTELEGRIKNNEGNIETNKNAISDIKQRTAGIKRDDVRNETTIENNVTVDNLGNVKAEGKLKGEGVDAGDGAITTTGAVNAGSLKVTDASNLKGDVTMDKTLSVTGDTSLNNTDVGGALNVTGASDLKGNVILGTNAANTVTVNGTANFNAAVNMDKGLTVTNGETNLKKTTVDGDLKVTGTITTDKMVFGDKATLNYTEIDKGHITSKNAALAGDATLKSSSMELDHSKLEVGVADKDSNGHLTMTADKTTIKNSDLTEKNYSEIVADKDSVTTTVKDEKGNTTSTKSSATEIRNYAKDKDGNKTINVQTATQNKSWAKDKDGNESSIVQTGKDITNTAQNGTITNDANHIENKANTMDTNVTGKATESYGELETTVNGNETHTVTGTKTETVDGKVTENYKAGQATNVTGNQDIHVTGKQTNTVEGGQENIISGGQTNTITGGQINNITGDQTTTITGNKTETVEGKVTENFQGGQETNVTGDQTTNVSGTQTTTATDINRNASSSMVDKVDNAYGTNTETKEAGKTTTDVSIKGTGEKGQYIRGANESRDYLIKDTLKNSETKTAEATSSEITDGTNTASTRQDAKNLAGSVTNGTETGISGIHANDDGSVSIDSAVVGGGMSSVINQKKDSIQSAVGDGTNSTVIHQDKDNVTIASSNGTVGIVGKDIVNNAQNTITNTAGTKITDTAGDSTVTTENGKGTTFTKTGSTAYREGGPTDTNISGNTITTGKVTMDYAEVMKDLGVHGNAKVDQNLEVTGTSKLTGDVTMENNATVGKNLTVNGTTNLNDTNVAGKLDVTKEATFHDSVHINKNLSVDGNANILGDVTAKSYKVGDKTYISADGINANNQKITNVADGSISEGSKDAVNGGQLYGVKRDLEHQVDKVGANAAAMANLRPMEFDPSSKWNIAAAIGNYGSETAAALGAFYRPNDNVMVNLSTAFGTGENMVGGGVSVRLGKGGNKLSREETNALKAQVADLSARMDALLSVLNPNMSKDFPDVPENHWAYEAVSRLAGNDIVQGYPDGEFHGERTMTRYEMAEIIYNALSRGAEAERELVEEFKPELQAMAASEKATAEKAEG